MMLLTSKQNGFSVSITMKHQKLLLKLCSLIIFISQSKSLLIPYIIYYISFLVATTGTSGSAPKMLCFHSCVLLFSTSFQIYILKLSIYPMNKEIVSWFQQNFQDKEIPNPSYKQLQYNKNWNTVYISTQNKKYKIIKTNCLNHIQK